MPHPPTLSSEQRQEALNQAAIARRIRADTKDELKLGSLSFDALLDLAKHDEMIGKMKVLAVLESMPGLGKVKSRRLMAEIGIASNRRLRGLGETQKVLLSEFFDSAIPASE
jgi:hypothetical protein|tara:strand:- start:22186 stop:22521 length:336 start_codon:yes stop_codon:yes gene_type:complete